MNSLRWTLRLMLVSIMAATTISFAQDAVVDTTGDGLMKAAEEAAMDTATEETAPAAEAVPAAKTETAPAVAAPAPAAVAAGDDEVVTLDRMVVVGYGTVKKSQMTSAVTTVDAKELNRTPSFSVEKAMQGKAAGVFISQNSGAPGKEMTVRIRGVGTINNSGPSWMGFRFQPSPTSTLRISPRCPFSRTPLPLPYMVHAVQTALF